MLFRSVFGLNDSRNPTISADGQFVLFESNALNLAAADSNTTTDVFLHQVSSGTNQLLSRQPSGTTGDLKSTAVGLSQDGSIAMFRSDSLTLLPPASGFPTDLYVYRRASDTVTRVALPGPDAGSGAPLYRTYNPVLSTDGRYLAFREIGRAHV